MYPQPGVVHGAVQSTEMLQIQAQMRKAQRYVVGGVSLIFISLPVIINGAVLTGLNKNNTWSVVLLILGIICIVAGVSMLVYGGRTTKRLQKSYCDELARNPQHLPVVSGMTPNSAYNNQAFTGPTSGAAYPPPPGLTSASPPTAPPYQPPPAPGTMYPPADALLTPYPPADASLTPVGVTSQAYGTQYNDWAKATPSGNDTGAPPPSYEDVTGV